MSNLQFDFETIHRINELKDIKKEYILELIDNAPKKVIFETAANLRDNKKGKAVSFSKKAFFNIINLCRDTCSYCTYKAEMNESKLSMMGIDEIKKLAEISAKFNCTEALLVTGERPEQKYPEVKHWLKNLGFTSTSEYLVHCSELLLEYGLFPHTNAGNLTKSEMSDLKKTNVSMGLMLENSSERLSNEGLPHEDAPSKHPKARIRTLKNAGELKIPITTGILVGIGETDSEIVDSLFTIKDIHNEYGNIQEVIIQNFQPKSDTKMKEHSPTQEEYFMRIVALARIILPEMNIQIPPNLSPNSYRQFLDAGINDWGGISPLTLDFVNPEFAWPQITRLEKECRKSGYELKARLPVYPEFINMIDDNLRNYVDVVTDERNYVKEKYWK